MVTPKIPPEQAEILTINELATWLRCAKSSIYRQIKAGKLPGFKVSKIWRFNRSDIEEWMDREAQRKPPQT